MFLEPTGSLATLAEQVLRLSDFFIDNPSGQTPWNDNFCQKAYRHYYLPLNYLRNEHIIKRGKEVNFFNGLETTIDWGAGPGTASLALAKHLQIKNQVLIEKSPEALKIFSDLHQNLRSPTLTSDLSLKKLSLQKQKTLLAFSYSLTEMTELPNGWQDFEALMILEPSTQQDGRKLLDVRKKLIAQGFYIWAPCLHQADCPLLLHSKHDWCHDRVHVQAPDWFKQLEEHLPFRNNTITTSYLLARKSKPTSDSNNKVRLIGDSLEEKGKTRQLICRGTNREFLTWMHKTIEPQTFPRGDLIELNAENTELKSNEVRLKNPI